MLLIVVACVPLIAQSQTQNNTQSNTQDTDAVNTQRRIKWDDRVKAAIALLERSPILKPKPANALSEDEFITLTRIVLGSVNLRALKLVDTAVDPANIDSVDEAVEGLEGLLRFPIHLYSATENPTRKKPEAAITSNPQNLKIRYRRTIDHRRNRGVFFNVRTNTTQGLDPAVYTFICTRENGEEEEQVVNCTKDCVVKFR
jgi:hypothetical protein